MVFNEHKRTFIDKEAFRILELFELTTEKKEYSKKPKGSIAHNIPNDLTDYLVDTPTFEETTFFDKTIAFKECYKGECIVLNEVNYKEFDKLVTTIYKDKNISSKISIEFIRNKSRFWFLKTIKQKQADCNFSTYILNEMEFSIEEYKIYYPILYLDIENVFCIGDIKFEFFTKEYFEKLINHHNEEKIGNENPFLSLQEKYQGKVCSTYIVKAEIEKAKEIAFEKCSLAVDVLKMCSNTTDVPQMKLSFDIDRRTKENAQNEIIITKPNPIGQKFKLSYSRLPSQHIIDQKEWHNMMERKLPVFHNFLLNDTDSRSELEQLIINGIKRYANAISNNNLHQRIVELFTILESLLLLDKNSPIIESVCKYCSKLVFKTVEDRKNLIELLKKMYDVRSSLIHHAKEIPLDIDELRKLQYTVIYLLISLIEKSKLHTNKQTILKEIDDAILSAY